MSNNEYIKNSIETRLTTGKYPLHNQWDIGVTNYPDEVKKRQGNPAGWYQWRAESTAEAKAVVQHYLKSFPPGTDDRMKEANNTRNLDSRKDVFVIMYPSEQSRY